MITSLDNDKIKELMRLKQRKYRDETGLFLVEGPHLVEEALKANQVQTLFVSVQTHFQHDDIEWVSETVMKKISDVMEPQGIVAICKRNDSSLFGERILMLDHLQDPGNVGTLLRSALAFGFTTVLYEETVDPYNPKVIRATQGALFHLDMMETNLINFIQNHPDYIVYGTALSDAISLSCIPRKDQKIAVILGNEGSGVRKELLSMTSTNIVIDSETVESLNVAVAGSIILYHLRRLEP